MRAGHRAATAVIRSGVRVRKNQRRAPDTSNGLHCPIVVCSIEGFATGDKLRVDATDTLATVRWLGSVGPWVRGSVGP